MEKFKTQPGFCPVCGSILPLLSSEGQVKCYNCKREYGPDVFGEEEVKFRINFNSFDPEKIQSALKKENNENEADGPIVERKCSKCGHDKMSYATVQLRSADEGQTVFFTCLKCKYKESENS